jgi:hypothetical protein
MSDVMAEGRSDAGNRAIAPDRAGTVLWIGIVGLLTWPFGIPLGVFAWYMGARVLRAMNEGRMDGAGRTVTQLGRAFGVTATIAFACSSGLRLAFLMVGAR